MSRRGPAKGAGRDRRRAASPRGIVDLEVTDMGLDGDALGHAGTCVVFVPGAIPGERVQVEAVTSNRKFCRASLRRVLRPSPHRIAPRCRHFGPCGGCSWQHIHYGHQLQLKQKLMASLLAHSLGAGAPTVDPTLGMEVPEGPACASGPWAFRDKVHFTLGPGPGGRGLAMGHYRRGSRSLLEVEECPVHAEAGNRIAFRARDLFRKHGVPGADEETLRGVARHLIVRVGERSGETQVTLVAATGKSKALERAARELAQGADAPEGIHLNVHNRPGPFLLGRVTKKLHGADRLREEVAGVPFLLSPKTFFQTNVRAAEILARVVMELVPAGEHGPILDLYAGAGLFSLPLVRRGHRLVAVEENPAAVADALASMRLGSIPPAACRYLRRRVEDVLRELAGGAARSEPRFATVILDPPREGCPAQAWSALLTRLRPDRIIYVSCNPRALAADLARAVRARYRIERVQPVDMFPHTAHIESVTLLLRGR